MRKNMTEQELQELRRARLVVFVANGGGPAAIGKKFGLPRSWESHYAQLKGGSSFGSRAARDLEEKFKLPALYFDRDENSYRMGFTDQLFVTEAVSAYNLDGSKGVVAIGDDEELPDAFLQIRESDVRFSAGPGRKATFEEIEDSVPMTYRKDWFIKEGINPEDAKRFKVSGDSMEPFLFDGDSVLVNLSETQIVNGKVYALRYGDELRIKRVYKRLDGGLVLHSDNPDFRPQDEEISPEVVSEHITVIGRVRDKSGTGGL